MPKLAPILLAESEPNDALLLRRAFAKVRIPNPLMVVEDGQQAIDYLGRKGPYKDTVEFPWPSLMLLSLRLPLLDGKEVLSWWKNHNCGIELPIIVITSIASPSQIEEIMSLGAADYRFKPRDFDELVGLAHELRFGWIEHRVSAIKPPPGLPYAATSGNGTGSRSSPSNPSMRS